ncbi:putative O-methyltransferase YrrM [Lutibacter oceani]|uniref:Putative O-methyltransferase YrrM n=2 Tax=Lutibacter oceani TaxID=1853311 RepID=A0A3D9RNY2_9FLAO|nr:putative O-methyltransferase YrrM [Lutibacter oceani]
MYMWFQIKSYFLFLIKSTNKHGVHSPFVFNLVTKCFNAKTNSQKLKQINSIRNYFYKNKTSIVVNDFGKGSKIFKSETRKIAKIAKIAGINKKRAALLIRIVEYFNPNTILELGTSIGLGTAALSLGNPNSKITTIEGCKNTAKVAQEMFREFNISNIKLVNNDFNICLPSILKENTFDLIYFDGNHQKEATLFYFNQCLSSIHPNSIFIFDDINWSKEMQETWKKIKNHPKVTVTINTYFWGIVFFRTEQAKQHFTIRV